MRLARPEADESAGCEGFSGLAGALLVGVSAAKMLAVALDVPLLGV